MEVCGARGLGDGGGVRWVNKGLAEAVDFLPA